MLTPGSSDITGVGLSPASTWRPKKAMGIRLAMLLVLRIAKTLVCGVPGKRETGDEGRDEVRVGKKISTRKF